MRKSRSPGTALARPGHESSRQPLAAQAPLAAPELGHFNVDDLPERLRSKIEAKVDGCWEWTAGQNGNGYGQVLWEREVRYVHRLVYELLVGPIPPGLQMDHLCRVRECCNPSHLEPVTCQENVRRGFGVAGVHARRTHCIHGHEFTPENTYNQPKRPHVRCCRQCRQDRHRAAYDARNPCAGSALDSEDRLRSTHAVGAGVVAIASGGSPRHPRSLTTLLREARS